MAKVEELMTLVDQLEAQHAAAHLLDSAIADLTQDEHALNPGFRCD